MLYAEQKPPESTGNGANSWPLVQRSWFLVHTRPLQPPPVLSVPFRSSSVPHIPGTELSKFQARDCCIGCGGASSRDSLGCSDITQALQRQLQRGHRQI